MTDFVVNGEVLVAILAVVASLVFNYFPRVRVWFAGLASEAKSLIMLGVLLVISAAILGLQCGGVLQTGISCDKNGLIQLIWYYILAVISNQASYLIAPETKDVAEAKAARNIIPGVWMDGG